MSGQKENNADTLSKIRGCKRRHYHKAKTPRRFRLVRKRVESPLMVLFDPESGPRDIQDHF